MIFGTEVGLMLKMLIGEIMKEQIEFRPMEVYSYPRKKDVVGQAGKFIDDFIKSMDSEQLYGMMGVKPDKSFMITGEPGNGKTMCIEALVNEANKEKYEHYTDKEVKLKLFGFKYDIGKYGTAYINEGSKIVQGFFDFCFDVAGVGYKTMIVFDEADNLFGHRRNSQSHKEDSKVLATIMKNLQVIHDRDNLYSVMMSNFPDAFDEASIRAGRIDKKYIFNKPNQTEREFAFQHTINKINDFAGYQVVRNYDTEQLAEKSKEFSYADVVESVNSAVKQRVKELIDVRKNKIITAGYVSQKRLEKSINKHGVNFKPVKKKIGF